MITITKINEVFLKISAEKYILQELSNYFTFDIDGARFSPAFKQKLWDGKKRLFNGQMRTIYVGLYQHILEFAEKSGYTINENSYKPEKDNYSIETVEKFVKEIVKPASQGIPLETRDYQINGIHHCVSNKRATILSPTSSGKSLLIYSIVRFLLSSKKIKRALFIFPGTSLVEQMYKDFIDYSSINEWDVVNRSHAIFSGQEKQTDKTLTFSTYQSLAKMPISFFGQFDAVFVDECFTGDTEILTNTGFVRFDKLTKTELVAQYDSGDISFTVPQRYIEKQFDGDLINIHSNKLIDLMLTPNHELLIQRKRKYEIVDIKLTANEVNFGYFTKLYVAGECSGSDNILTAFEKLMIVTQADGHILNTDRSTIQFKFSKQRKIDEFLLLMEEGGFNFVENKKVNAIKNTKEVRRFSVYDVENISKNVYDFFDISELSLNKAKSIIEYMVLWDGSINKRTSQYYYSSTDEKCVDFYQAISVLCGYKTNKTKQIDIRNDNYNDVHRLFITKENTIGTQNISKTNITFSGKVYCVTVPSGNIIVRRNGFVTVVGNCQTAKSKSIVDIMERCHDIEYRFGFSGTIPDGKSGKAHRLVIEGLFDKVFETISTDELIKRGQVTNLKIKSVLLKYPDSIKKLFPTVKYPEEMKYLIENKQRNKFIVNLANNLTGNTLILFNFIEHGKTLLKLLEGRGNVHFITGDNSVEEREHVRQIAESTDDCLIVATYGVFSTGINIRNLHNCIIASPTKSRIRLFQSLGRILRLSNGKTVCTLYDIGDDLSWKSNRNHTLKHFMERIKYYAEAKLKYKIIEHQLINQMK